MTTSTRPGRGGRARRHLLVAGFVLAYLAAGAMTLALGDRVAGGGWLALHLVLLGADRFEEAFAAGARLTLREAVAALQDRRGAGTTAP